jgi:hypothetical protein
MNEMTLDQNEEEPLTYEVSDEVLEVAGCAETAKQTHLRSGSVLLCIFALVLNGTPNRATKSGHFRSSTPR